MDFNFLTNFSKEDILKISSFNPEKFFLKVENEEDLKKVYRKLSSVWHPDKHMTEKTDVVFAHIQTLSEAAREKFNRQTQQIEERDQKIESLQKTLQNENPDQAIGIASQKGIFAPKNTEKQDLLPQMSGTKLTH